MRRSGSSRKQLKSALGLFISFKEADCGSVVDRWEELQPDAGR